MGRVLIWLVRVYQHLISPMLGPHCRFYPSCSHYAIQAIACHGPMKGAYLSILRLLRCHPWHPGGFDPVPTNSRNTNG